MCRVGCRFLSGRMELVKEGFGIVFVIISSVISFVSRFIRFRDCFKYFYRRKLFLCIFYNNFLVYFIFIDVCMENFEEE